MRLSSLKLVCMVVFLSTIICMITLDDGSYSDFKYFVNNNFTQSFLSEEPCACAESCVAESDDVWFNQRFRTDIPPLLSLENSELPDNISKWWRGLQRPLRKAEYKEVIQELFDVIPKDGHYRDAGPNRCRTCAVVGNSGNLLNSHYGPLIDSNDFVIRMNKGPVKGFEKDVGARTTHRVLYPESAVQLDNDTHVLLLPFKLLDIQWITSALTNGTITKTRFQVINKLQADRDKVMVMHPTFMHYVHHTWLHITARRSYPSTGFLALMFALHVCDQINVFGFGANNKGTWHHYFEATNRRFRGTGKHSGGFENNAIKELQKRKKITLYKGW